MNYKKFLPDVLMVALFAVISLAYFWHPIMDGLVLTGTDHNAAVGSNVELSEYRKAHNGERTRWTNSLFSGMPTYQMSPSYDSTDTLSTIEQVYQLGLPTVAGYIFMLLLGFYILLRAFDFRQWMAALGAILWAFSSYYFIIIAAGHIWKLLTLCFIPPTIAGMVLCYRGKYLWGIVVTGLFTGLQIFSNHIQMSYYFFPVMVLMALAYLVESLKLKVESSPSNEANSSAKQLSTFNFQLSTWLKGTLAAIVGGLLGVSINVSNLYHTYEYSKETMRGKSELTQKTKDAADQTSSGLELRHRGDLDPARAQHQGRRIGSPDPEQDGNGEGQERISPPLSATRPVLGRTARNERSRLRGSLRHVPLHPGSVHRQRSALPY